MTRFSRPLVKYAATTVVLAAAMGMYVGGYWLGLQEGWQSGWEAYQANPGSEHSRGYRQGWRDCMQDLGLLGK